MFVYKGISSVLLKLTLQNRFALGFIEKKRKKKKASLVAEIVAYLSTVNKEFKKVLYTDF